MASPSRHPVIIGIGSYLPERRVTNEEILALTNSAVVEKLEKINGIHCRYWIAGDQVTSDLIVEASKKALARAGVAAAELDLIIVSTDSPDYIAPCTASAVQHKLGAENAGCYDVNAACAGFVVALDQAARYIMTDLSLRYVLVAAGYAMTRYHDASHPTMFMAIASDSGTAVVLGVGRERSLLASHFYTIAKYRECLGVFTGGTFRPATSANLEAFGSQHVGVLRLDPETLSINETTWPKVMQKALEKAGGGLSFDDINHYYFTQIRVVNIQAVMHSIRQPMEKTHCVMDRLGYTGSGCVINALEDAILQGKGPKAGDNIMFCASGAGFNFAAMVWRWTDEHLRIA